MTKKNERSDCYALLLCVKIQKNQSRLRSVTVNFTILLSQGKVSVTLLEENNISGFSTIISQPLSALREGGEIWRQLYASFYSFV